MALIGPMVMAGLLAFLIWAFWALSYIPALIFGALIGLSLAISLVYRAGDHLPARESAILGAAFNWSCRATFYGACMIGSIVAWTLEHRGGSRSGTSTDL